MEQKSSLQNLSTSFGPLKTEFSNKNLANSDFRSLELSN